MEIKPIATIYTPFGDKFGVPRQSGLAATKAKIVFEPSYRNPEAVRGLEDYSHIWLIWQFSQSIREEWSPTVRPPRLGGNKRMGVFSTRSPFRPNNLGLSSVKLLNIDFDSAEGPVLYVEGADMTNGTPIFDIKPYLSYTDSHPEAKCGFASEALGYKLSVNISANQLDKIPQEHLTPLISILENDPRPSYHNDPERIYKMSFLDYTVEFAVEDSALTLIDIYHTEAL